MNWQTLKHASVEAILSWAESQPWCREMAACAQDAAWHAEGDVWTHTRLVCQQLHQLDEWATLSAGEQSVLLFAALFHDAAKPQCSRVDAATGRITSPNHAVKGEQLARIVLRELGADLESREQVARLVRYHGRPAFLLERPAPTHEVVSMSWLTDNRLLYMLALADTRGRQTESMSRPEENIHLWKLQAEELTCFDRPYQFGNDQARFLFFHNPSPDLQYTPHEEYCCTVTLVCGLPGSGKDTWLASHRSHVPTVSLDAIRNELRVSPADSQGAVIQLARERCRQHLRRGISFAFNATNTIKQTRQKWIRLFAAYGARIEVVYLEPPLHRILRQNRQRRTPVPEGIICYLAAKTEPPTWAEAHQLVMTESP